MVDFPIIKRAELTPLMLGGTPNYYPPKQVVEERRSRATFNRALIEEIDAFVATCEERRKDYTGWGFACEIPKIWRDKLLQEVVLDEK